MTGVTLDRIRYEPENHSFRVQGVDIEPIRDDVIVFPFEILKNVSVAYLAKALERYRDFDGGYFEDVFLSDTPLADFDADTASRDVRLEFGPLGLEVEGAQIVAKGEEPSPEDTQALVAPLLARHRARWVSQEETTREGGPWSVIVVGVELVPGARPVADLRALSEDLNALLGAVAGGVISASAAADLIRAGYASALLGQREGSYLDAKGAPYDARGDAGAWELAKDVAAFANTGQDALIVMGISTRRDANGDVFDALRAFDLTTFDVGAARAILRDRIVPLIPNVDVSTVESRGGYGYGLIYIPAQPPEAIPFIVVGALVGSSIRGAYVTVPFRAGEDTYSLDASMIHSLIAAGRVALRG